MAAYECGPLYHSVTWSQELDASIPSGLEREGNSRYPKNLTRSICKQVQKSRNTELTLVSLVKESSDLAMMMTIDSLLANNKD